MAVILTILSTILWKGFANQVLIKWNVLDGDENGDLIQLFKTNFTFLEKR